ncbi:MAG: glycosyltransferase family 4 protein [bacterium]
MKNVNTLSCTFIATYPPRECGIGTFTHDLVKNLKQLSQSSSQREDHLQVIAINNISEGYDYTQEVNLTIREQYKSDYREAAEFLNQSVVDVVSLQHEYGIFGGDDGGHIVYLLNNLKKPVVTTLHTVLDKPSPGQKKILETIVSLSTLVVVLTDKAVQILTRVYGFSREKIAVIPHGAPDVPFLDTSYYKDNFQAENRQVLMTFGLLNPNKGIEYVINALPPIVKKYPQILYIILGATHPNVKRDHGEKYRVFLERRVNELGLGKNVIFHNRFVSLERLIQFLVATDIYITPYLVREQISSGTLAYALACGKAIISTPYWYAEELLKDDRGILVPFKDSAEMTNQISGLLGNESKRNRLRKQAYQYGRRMIWSEIAKQYDKVFERAVTEYGRKKRKTRLCRDSVEQPALPEIKLDHLRLLTDDTGILQHAMYRTPNRVDGYTADDNARALMTAVVHFDMFHEQGVLDLLHTYLAFLNHSFHPRLLRFRNFMSYSREWLEDVGSEDSHGRVLRSLGYTIRTAPSDEILSLSNQLFKQGLKITLQFSSPRAWAFTILGCLLYLSRFSGDTETKNIVIELGKRLSVMYSHNKDKNWHWFEDVVTYSNARLPEALIAASDYLGDETMLKQGIESLQWLLEIQTSSNGGHLSLIGNNGWYRKGGTKPKYDQQPEEVLSIMEACVCAQKVTGKKVWQKEVDKAFTWFLGKNDINECLYDFRTGGCYDGLQRGGVNLNQGAESTLTWLRALHLMYGIVHQAEVVTPETKSKRKRTRVGR